MSKYECNRRSDLGRVQRDGRRNSCGRGNVTRTMGAFWRSSHMSSLGSACDIAKGEAHATEAPNHESVGHGRAEAVETGVNGLDVLRGVVELSVARFSVELSQPSDDVSIRGVNQGFEWWTVNGMRRSDFDVAHVLSCAIEKTCRIGQRRAVKKTNVHVRREHIDVTERRVLHARGRAAVVHEFPHVFAAMSHQCKPRSRN